MYLSTYKHISLRKTIESRYESNLTHEYKDAFKQGNITQKIAILKQDNYTKEEVYFLLKNNYKFRELVKDTNETFHKIYDEVK